MTTHEIDQHREINHADENYGVDSEGDEVAGQQAAEAEAEEPMVGYFDTDDAATDADDDDDEAIGEDEGTVTDDLGDTDDDPAPEAIPLGQGDAADITVADDLDAPDDDTTDDEADDDTEVDEAVADDLAETDVDTDDGTDDETEAVALEEGDDEGDLAAQPVIVELDETDVELLAEPADTDETDQADDDLDADESVLLTESAPGSVLPLEDEAYTTIDDTDDVTDETDETDETDDVTEAGADIEVEDEPLPVPKLSPVASLEPVGPDAPLDPGSGTYQERWSAIQGSFVDEPLRAVESAGSLVAQMWHEFERSVAEQRDALDSGWATASSTDDLRTAFQEYRELFHRLTGLLSS